MRRLGAALPAPSFCIQQEVRRLDMAMRRFDPRQAQRGPQIRINQRIRVPEVRVVAEDGSMLGIHRE